MNFANLSIRWKIQIANCAILLPLYAVGFSVYLAVWEQAIGWYEMIWPAGMLVFFPIAFNDGQAVATRGQRLMLVLVGLLAMAIVLTACCLLDWVNNNPEIRWWGLLAWSAVAGLAAATVVFAVAHFLCPWNLYGEGQTLSAKLTAKPPTPAQSC